MSDKLSVMIERAERRYCDEQQNGDEISVASTRGYFLGLKDANEHLKKLVRERDEARKSLEFQTKLSREVIEREKQTCKERDEAKKQVEQLKQYALKLDDWNDKLQSEVERLKKQIMGDNEGAIIVSDMTEEIQQLKAEIERLREKFRKLGDLLGDPIGGEFQSLEKAVSDLMIQAAMKGAE